MGVRLTREPLSLDAVYAAVRSPARGGVALFSGVVRASEDGAPISRIDYEAYEPLALKELARIAARAEESHGAAVEVHHRLGPVPAGEASVLVAAAAAHRAEAFAACREVIDRLKETVPIWKADFA
ncbi:MAG: molybdenum cofactor biosynthesis protein MoaE [Elusimicrobia bacterium]|nr:molybdenum cofactor biosynthesis protein MoaE [Elusimicrobiota bacterium]